MFGRLSAAQCNNQLAEGCNVENGRRKGICALPRLHHTLQHRTGYPRCTTASSSGNAVNVHAAATSVLACEADDAVHELLVHVVHGGSNSKQPHQQQVQSRGHTQQQQQQWRQRGPSDMPQLQQHSQLLEQHWQQFEQQQQHHVGHSQSEFALQGQQQSKPYSASKREAGTPIPPAYWQPDMQLQLLQQQAAVQPAVTGSGHHGCTSTHVQHIQVQSHMVPAATAAEAGTAVEVPNDGSCVVREHAGQPGAVITQQRGAVTSSSPDMLGWTKQEMLQGWRHNRQDNIARTAAGVALLRITSRAAPHRVAAAALRWLLKEQQVVLSVAGPGLSYHVLQCVVHLMQRQQEQPQQQQWQEPGQGLSHKPAGAQTGLDRVLVTVNCRTSPRPNGGRTTVFDLLCQLQPAGQPMPHTQQLQRLSRLNASQQQAQVQHGSSSVDGSTASLFHHHLQQLGQHNEVAGLQHQQRSSGGSIIQALSASRRSSCCSLMTVPGSGSCEQQGALTYSSCGSQHVQSSNGSSASSSSSSSILHEQDVLSINALAVAAAPPGHAWQVQQGDPASLPTWQQAAFLQGSVQRVQHHPECQCQEQQQQRQQQQHRRRLRQQQQPPPSPPPLGPDDVDQLLLQADQLLSEASGVATADAVPVPHDAALTSAAAANGAVQPAGAAASSLPVQLQVAGHPTDLADSINAAVQSGAAVVAPVAHPKQVAKLLQAVSLANRALQLSGSPIQSSSSSSSSSHSSSANSDLQFCQVDVQQSGSCNSSQAFMDVSDGVSSLTAQPSADRSHQMQLVLEPRLCLLQRQSKKISGMLVYMYCAPFLVHQR